MKDRSENISTSQPAKSAPRVTDRYGRTLRYIRLSVTDLCNLSCTYCNPVQGCASTHPHKLSWDDLAFLVDVSVNDLGAEAVRITGGEPTIRPGLIDWIFRINQHPGLIDIAMTTNGIRLRQLAAPLRQAGLRRVNISLDSFDAERYREVTRGGSLQRCLEGIDAAREHFDRVKLNAVLLRHGNLEELPRFIDYSHEKGIEVRFIELMPLWEEKDYFHREFISVEDVMHHIAGMGYVLEPEGDGRAEGNKTGYGPATTYGVRGSDARIGFISQMSNTKCLSCNKLRLTSDGALKPCLLSPDEQDLAPAIKERDRAVVAREMSHQFLIRAERYDALEALTKPFHRSMQSIGG